MQAVTKARWQIHFCVLLWGFTAILGKTITLPALPLTSVVLRMRDCRKRARVAAGFTVRERRATSD